MTWPRISKTAAIGAEGFVLPGGCANRDAGAGYCRTNRCPQGRNREDPAVAGLGGFVTPRRGTKGGFQLAKSADGITMSEVIDFFLARHPVEEDRNSPVVALRQAMAPGQRKFARLTLAEVAHFPQADPRRFPSKHAFGGFQYS